jgi:hypothetical protein
MGGPIDADERTPLSGDKPGPSRRRLIIKKLLFMALVFAAIVALVSVVFTSKTSVSVLIIYSCSFEGWLDWSLEVKFVP